MTYYNRFDPAFFWQELRAEPGRSIQSAEWNEVQAMLMNFMRNMGNYAFQDGRLVSGANPTILGTTVSIPESWVYADGLMRKITANTVSITGAGTEIIGLKLTESIVDAGGEAVGETSYRDPVGDYPNYNQAGCYRKKVVPSWVISGYDYAIYTYVNGVLTTVNRLNNALGYTVGNSSGNIPLNNGGLNTNLNAQLLNGQLSTYYRYPGDGDPLTWDAGRVKANGANASIYYADQAGYAADANLLDGKNSNQFVRFRGVLGDFDPNFMMQAGNAEFPLAGVKDIAFLTPYDDVPYVVMTMQDPPNYYSTPKIVPPSPSVAGFTADCITFDTIGGTYVSPRPASVAFTWIAVGPKAV